MEMVETKNNHLQDIEAQDDPEEDEDTKKWRDMERTVTTRVVQGTAGASIVLNLVAMVLEGGSAIAMGLIAIVVGAVVIYFQFMIQDTDTLRKVQNDLRHKVNDFARENVELKNNNARLEGELVPLKESQIQLEKIATKNGSDVNKLRALVKDNQTTLDAMNATLQEDVLQDLMEAVLESERSEDGTFDDQELKRLLLRLKGLPSIQVNEEKFMKRAQLHRSISDVFGLIKTITDDTPDEERIFTITGNVADKV